ncbi:MAG: GIY-YIG nuclease family protein [Tepidisphaera sp.]
MTTTVKQRPFSIRIFVADGSPSGIRTVEKSNWSGRGVVFPRSSYQEAKQRREFDKTGVYVLTGPSESTGALRIYVGEGDPIRPRLDSHSSKKEFWTQGFAFVSKDDNLNKAHVQYLESRLVALAATAKRCEIDNANVPDRPSLSEADEAETDGFLAEMLLCFPVLGLGVFEQPSAVVVSTPRLRASGKGAEASGYESDDGFVIEEGSTAALTETPTTPPYVTALRRQLLESGVLVRTGEIYRFTQRYVMSSPSTAAAVVLARNANGRREWRDSQGRELRELQELSGR